ncbi:hypothetical protein EMCRGX_G018426 [Ephydatia muelleri]
MWNVLLNREATGHSSCQVAISALEQSSGCCRYYVLNGPKVVCGQQPIAPCPNVLNSGSVVAPSSECAYLLEYGIESTKFIPSLNPTCLASLQTACSNSTYCSPSCLAAITAAEKHGGCCYAQYLNGPKALCGQQPIAPCSTTVSRGSEGIGFNILLILFMVAVQRAIY